MIFKTAASSQLSSTPSKSISSTRAHFLTEINRATETVCDGRIRLWRDLFSNQQMVDEAFELLNNDQHFPWNHNPTLYGQKLTQHAYQYNRAAYNREQLCQHYQGLQWVEDTCSLLRNRFDVKINHVYCNRLVDPKQHKLDWHTDTYGTHIMVLSLGTERTIEFRPLANRQQQAEGLRPRAGDLYFMPLQLNSTHEHRVCPADDNDGGSSTAPGPRISLVFFVETPKYAKEYRITTGQRMRGFLESMIG